MSVYKYSSYNVYVICELTDLENHFSEENNGRPANCLQEANPPKQRKPVHSFLAKLFPSRIT